MNEKATQAIELVRQAAREAAAAGELPTFLGALEAVRVEAILEAARQAVESGAEKKRDRVLTVKQTAERLGRSPSWVYKEQERPTGRPVQHGRLRLLRASVGGVDSAGDKRPTTKRISLAYCA